MRPVCSRNDTDAELPRDRHLQTHKEDELVREL